MYVQLHQPGSGLVHERAPGPPTVCRGWTLGHCVISHLIQCLLDLSMFSDARYYMFNILDVSSASTVSSEWRHSFVHPAIPRQPLELIHMSRFGRWPSLPAPYMLPDPKPPLHGHFHPCCSSEYFLVHFSFRHYQMMDGCHLTGSPT